MSMSFALVDAGLSPSYWAISISLGCLLPQVRNINPVIYEDDGF